MCSENLFNPQALSWARNATGLFSRNHAADSQFSERQFEPSFAKLPAVSTSIRFISLIIYPAPNYYLGLNSHTLTVYKRRSKQYVQLDCITLAVSFTIYGLYIWPIGLELCRAVLVVSFPVGGARGGGKYPGSFDRDIGSRADNSATWWRNHTDWPMA